MDTRMGGEDERSGAAAPTSDTAVIDTASAKKLRRPGGLTARLAGARRRRRAGRDAGFTLTELMVTILIIGILSTAAVLTVFGLLDNARTTRVQSDLRVMSNALDYYRATLGSYPTTDQGLEALVRAPAGLRNANRYPPQGFMQKVPTDPWGTEYVYEVPGADGRPYTLLSLGADGQPGGVDEGADISFWDF